MDGELPTGFSAFDTSSAAEEAPAVLSQGPKGDKGDKGDTGTTGAAGAVGATGAGLPFPGYKSGWWYPTFAGPATNATSLSSFSGELFLYPFTPLADISPSDLGIIVAQSVSGATGKVAVWANDPATQRPTGTPIMGTNTAQSLATAGTPGIFPVSGMLSKGVTYWVGFAADHAAILLALSNVPGEMLTAAIGRPDGTSKFAFNNLSTAFTFSGDITTLDLTSATLTLNATVPPIIFLVAP